MALVKCKECGASISSKAEACPNCGAKRKPTKSITRKIVYACVALFVLVVVFDMTSHSELAKPPSGTGLPAVAAATHPAAAGPASAEPTRRWVYDTNSDSMRKTEIRYARITGLESLRFDFPYKRELNYPSLTVRSDKAIYIEVPAGQFLCTIDCAIALKFDNSPVRNVRGHSASDGSSTIVFLPYESTLASLKKAKHLIVEATFYQSGSRQMPFDVEGLEWR